MFKTLEFNCIDTTVHASYEVTVMLGKKKKSSFNE